MTIENPDFSRFWQKISPILDRQYDLVKFFFLANKQMFNKGLYTTYFILDVEFWPHMYKQFNNFKIII